MKVGSVVALCCAALGATGCASVPGFHAVDLSRDLSSEAIRRYEAEWEAMRAAGHRESTAVLEYTNWWLTGLLVYHRRGVVTRMPGPGGPMYMVESGQGFGPLSILYATSTHATFSAAGERLSAMRMDNALIGHLAMGHQSETVLKNGQVEKSRSLHLIHHLLAVHQMHGQTYVSLLTIPNAIGGTISGPDGGGAGHAAHAPAARASADTGDHLWTCSMHRDVRSATPGACPTCGMALQPVKT